jgi:hypothetical protein
VVCGALIHERSFSNLRILFKTILPVILTLFGWLLVGIGKPWFSSVRIMNAEMFS